MRGLNPIRKPLQHDGLSLEVKSIFPTLQGEGPYTGWPSVFVRLGGCNLACSFCDTEFEDYREMQVEDILAEVIRYSSPHRGEVRRGASEEKFLHSGPHPNPPPMGEGIKLVVITGGEPLRQNIAPLCKALLAEGFKVQIETNGTLWRELPEAVEIVCSPKNTHGTYAPVRGDLLARVNAFKFIISAANENYNHVGAVGQEQFNTPVYVQPMDEYDEAKNRDNLALAMKLAGENGYRLSLQTHKILGIP